MKEWKISRADAGQPLKKFCMKYLTAAPQSFMARLFRRDTRDHAAEEAQAMFNAQAESMEESTSQE